MEAFEIEQSKITKKHCCKDELEVVKGQDKLKRSQFEEVTFEQQVFVFSFIYSYTNSLEELPNLIIPHKYYSPPILIDETNPHKIPHRPEGFQPSEYQR